MTHPRILLVEDELIIAAHIASVIRSANYEVVETLTRGESVIDFVTNNPIDVILMDINLAGKLDGIETAEIVYQNFGIPVVFLTANVDSVTFERAKRAYPHAFIAKPFKAEDLLRTLELLFNQKDFDSTRKSQRPEQTSESLVDRVFVRDKNKMVKLKIEEILYVEAERNYCTIATKNKNYTLSVPLKKFESKVNNDIFVRVHRSFLVNIKAIDELDEHYVFIQKKSIPLSKSYKQELVRRLTLI